MSEEKQVVPAAAGEGGDGDAKTKKQAEAEIIKEFQKLKEEKNNISTKMAEIKMDMNEHEYDEHHFDLLRAEIMCAGCA